MSATKDYFKQQIADTASKAMGVPVSSVSLDGAVVVVTLSIDAPENPFWAAVLEQTED